MVKVNDLSGFVDLQVNGFLGVDFSSPDLTEADFVRACRALLVQGTAAFLPTMITSSLDVYARNLPLMADVMARDEFQGRLLGFHLEGPFISRVPGAVGAHNPAYVRDPDTDSGYVSTVTLRTDRDRARKALTAELERAYSAMTRAYDVGASLGISSEIEEIRARIVGMKVAV